MLEPVYKAIHDIRLILYLLVIVTTCRLPHDDEGGDDNIIVIVNINAVIIPILEMRHRAKVTCLNPHS